MIFATVGTQKFQFERFVKIINQIDDLQIIFQYGHCKIEERKKNIEYFDFKDDISQYLENADIIITHGGVGTIMSALRLNKKIIVISRKEKYNEHINDHQEEIVKKLAKKKYIYELNEGEDINEIIKLINEDVFTLNNYEFGNKKLALDIKREILEN